jgi:hypothetical protein
MLMQLIFLAKEGLPSVKATGELCLGRGNMDTLSSLKKLAILPNQGLQKTATKHSSLCQSLGRCQENSATVLAKVHLHETLQLMSLTRKMSRKLSDSARQGPESNSIASEEEK